MGLLSNPLRSREQRLPVYENVAPSSPTKERYSDDEYYSSDDSEAYSPGDSPGSSRNTSGSMSSSRLMLPKRTSAPLRRPATMYPYRLPPKITRYISCGIIGLIVLMILSLVRASQVENWKVANGKIEQRPPPPPVWEKFPFLERYYGGIRTLVSFEDLKPEYPRDKDEPSLFSETEPITADHKTEQQPDEAAPVDETKKVEEETAKVEGVEKDDKTTKDEQVAEAGESKATKDEEQTEKTESPKPKRDIAKSQSWDKYSDRSVEADAKECFIDEAGKIRIPQLRYYNGRPQGFPQHVSGSYEVLNLPEDVCFERFGRYGPYGFGYSQRAGGLGTGENGESEGSPEVWKETPRVDYRSVDWATVQRRCYHLNADRFTELPPKTLTPYGFFIHDFNSSSIQARAAKDEVATTPAVEKEDDSKKAAEPTEEEETKVSKTDKPKAQSQNKKSRTAIVIRCWDEYFFREDDIANIRSMITELSLASGGRYDVHLLVQVKNDAAHAIWADKDVYERRINDVIPEEFRGIVTLWTETQMLALYQGVHDLFSRGPELPVHGVYRGLSMAMQYFAYMHPEYEHFWQWEMDVRYTGHYYDFITKIESWAKAQPRKGLWERNARFYFPKVHGSWDDFSQMARVQSEMGTLSADNVWRGLPGAKGKRPEEMTRNDKTVWGPQRPQDDDDWFEPQNDPIAPSSYEQDRYEWGVDEEADYISLNPMFDPDGTTWALKDDITGYNRSAGLPPRRANIITTARLSRRLLLTMHKMTALKKQFAFPEMWPATVAIQHGFKAVFAPHPMYVDRKWPVEYMASMFNGGRDGGSGGSRTSIFGDREHNLHGLTWFYNSGFAPNLYRRWLGLKVNNDGGEEFEMTEDKSKKGGQGVGNMPGGEGRMCLPPMLLHPIKDVDLPVEAPPEKEEEAPISDPSA